MHRSCLILAACWGVGIASWAAELATTELPPLTNVWEQAHVCVVDKDTNCVFINANERFLSTLRPSFPELQTVSDLRGKTDFDFYPVELAEKYRADDQQVLQAGLPWETLEENQPIGSAPTYVYVSKTPLRNAAGALYALRILFYSIPAPGQTVLPEFDDPWLAAHTQVMDKDTHSVFINANEVFLATLRPSFPEIRSVTNLIGRDDFYFYSSELAEKYRADDRRVLQSGTAWEGIEVNQPLGGRKQFVKVTKTPLRNESSEVVALRIMAWSLPQIEISRSGAVVTLSWDAAFADFDLQAAASLGPAGAWTAVTPPTTQVADRIEAVLPAEASAQCFRLLHLKP